MNLPENDPETIRRVHQALQALPNGLRAPETLELRVIAAIQKREIVASRSLGWETWPLPVRSVALALLTLTFVLICAGAERVSGLSIFLSLQQTFQSVLSTGTTLWQAGATVVGAASRFLAIFPSGWLTGCMVAALLSFFMVVGLGTVCVRLGLAPRK